MPNLWCACEVQMSNNAPEDTADKPRVQGPGGGVDCALPLSECHFGGGGLATAAGTTRFRPSDSLSLSLVSLPNLLCQLCAHDLDCLSQ